MPTLTTFADADAFLRVVGPTLEEHETEHHLVLGLATALRIASPSPSTAPFLAAVDDGAGLALAALMNPTRPLVLASDREDITTTLEPLWNALTADGHAPGQLHAMVSHAEAAVRHWERHTGCATQLRMRQRLHALTAVREVRLPHGELRVAEMADVELVGEWMAAFDRDALGEASADEAMERGRHRVRAGEIYLWIDREPRSMAGLTRPTTRGIAINAVYTPAESRGRGYATGCVAALSARMLDEGRAFCVLYTDLANATSNAIYTRIGYRGIRDFDLYDL